MDRRAGAVLEVHEAHPAEARLGGVDLDGSGHEGLLLAGPGPAGVPLLDAARAGDVDAAVAALGAVDILVPNAGGPPPGTFASTAVDAYPAALELNLLSIVAMCKAAVPTMQERDWGRVVAITSVSVRQPISFRIEANDRERWPPRQQ